MNSCIKPIADLALSLPADKGFALIPNRRLYELYALMLHSRLLAERLPSLARNGSFGPLADTCGQEAPIVAATIDLTRGDTLAPGAGALVPCYLKGLPLASIRALIAGGKSRIVWSRFGLVSPTLALEAQLEQALAAAAAHRAAKSGKIAVAFCGDSAANPALLRKALRRAGKEKLPILFVCSTATEDEEIAGLADRYGFPGIVAEAHDAVAVYRVVTESMAHARRGNGATLIECRPWPLADAIADPLEKMEAALKRRGIFTARFKTQTAAAFKRLLAVR
ncbi:MAG: thiamine pyrophosphate-dependent enzyme [Terracidiphilus sp.]|nr:thiamine pyrophosphate-dependent enzyme [Terracidiphilus sp.]